MDRRYGIRGFVVLTALGLLGGCAGEVPVEALPSANETLAAVGVRLSRSKSVQELNEIARRGDRVLAVLTRAERDALGRNYVRFRVDRPVILEVAVPAGAVPFWLADRGFVRSARPLRVGREEWAAYRRRFDAGWVGLGVNGLDRGPTAHYAVFVRAEDGRPIAVRGLDGDRWRAVASGDGVSLAFDMSLPIRDFPGDLRGATLLRSAHDRRHSTLLARGRVWKTHVPSSREPDQVAIAFGDDGARSLVWTWRTRPDVKGTALRLAPAAPGGGGQNDPRLVRVVRGEARPVETPELLNDPTILRHRASASGLEPDTVYAYSIGDGTAEGWSPWRTVKTAPAHPRRFSLLYLGDAQCGLEGWGRLLKEAYRRRPDVGVILLAGDLVDRGNERSNWDHFWLRASGVFDRVPLMPCAGNHEYLDQGPRLYRSFFDLPTNGPRGIDSKLVYSFEYGDAFIAVLDSTLGVSSPNQAAEQAAWLDRELWRTRATWKLVMFHHPLYASHPWRESPALRDAWVPVLDKHHVDLVLQGHDHAYLRSYPMRGGRRVDSPGEGTVYVVAVSGEKYCEQDPRGYTAAGLTHVSTYQTIDIDVPERRLTFVAWDAEGRERDRLVIDKGRDRTNLVRSEPVSGRSR